MYSTILPFAFALPANSLVFDVGALYQHLQSLADQRDRRGLRYPLALILTIAVLAKLAGQNRVQGCPYSSPQMELHTSVCTSRCTGWSSPCAVPER